MEKGTQGKGLSFYKVVIRIVQNASLPCICLFYGLVEIEYQEVCPGPCIVYCQSLSLGLILGKRTVHVRIHRSVVILGKNIRD